MKKIMNNKKGFSFLELMIVIAIAGIMTVAMLVPMNAQREKKAVETAAREVAAIVRETQTYALTGKGLQGHPACSFTFNWEASSNYSLSGCKIQNYSLKNGVTFSNGGSFSFSVPAAIITASMAFPVDIVLSRGGSSYHVCVYKSGVVSESSMACPT
jgi:prepilin-type N-terminal cleavage/methylation domain-containing protein